jgi:hypothetical protein
MPWMSGRQAEKILSELVFQMQLKLQRRTKVLVQLQKKLVPQTSWLGLGMGLVQTRNQRKYLKKIQSQLMIRNLKLQCCQEFQNQSPVMRWKMSACCYLNQKELAEADQKSKKKQRPVLCWERFRYQHFQKKG